MKYGLRPSCWLFVSVLFGCMHGIAHAGLDEGTAALKTGDYATAIRELEPLAASGNGQAQFMLGRLYAGRGQLSEAFNWYRMAAEQGDPRAQYFIGVDYIFDNHVAIVVIFPLLIGSQSGHSQNLQN